MSFLLQTSAQQALTGTINSSMQAVQAAQASLTDFDTLPPLGTDAVRHTKPFNTSTTLIICNTDCCLVHTSDSSNNFFALVPYCFACKASQAWRKNKMDESKHEIHSQVDAITAGTASMVNLTAGESTCMHTFCYIKH